MFAKSVFGARQRLGFAAAGAAAVVGTALVHQAHAAEPATPFTQMGVYLWGDNTKQLIAKPVGGKPAGANVRVPTPVDLFSNQKLRDLALCPTFGLAALANGDVVQFDSDTASLREGAVLKGKNVTKVLVAPRSETALALAKNGAVFGWSAGAKPTKYQVAGGLGWFEKIDDIACGVDHIVAKTNKGRVFSGQLLAADGHELEHHGQFGIASFSHFESPPPPFELHEIKLLPGKVGEISCGNYHTLFLNENREFWGCGSNSYGQLMLPFTFKNMKNSVPVKLGTDAVRIAAGSNVSLFQQRGVLSWHVAGDGEFGQFGTGSFAQCQVDPLNMKPLSNMREYDEVLNRVVPTFVRNWQIGATHIYAQMDNAAGDWLMWGSNERGQLGNSKLSKIVKPIPVKSSENFALSDGYQFVAGDKISGCFVRA